MSSFRQAAEDYLAIRRELGFKLARHEPLLASFVAFLDHAGASFVSVDLAVSWAGQAEGSSTWHKARLSVVRGFAIYLETLDPRTQISPANLIASSGRASRRAVPYLYSAGDIEALMNAARTLRPLQAATYETLIGLLAVSGMRAGEAIRLDDDDLDSGRSLLLVRDTKFGKSREVPLHQTALHALERYLKRRRELLPTATGPSLFVSTAGTRLRYNVVQDIFADLCRKARVTARSERCRPTLHSLRHSYAVSTLLEWYQAGADVPALLPRLSTVLGHVDPASTYWYLEASPELLQAAASRLERLGGDRR